MMDLDRIMIDEDGVIECGVCGSTDWHLAWVNDRLMMNCRSYCTPDESEIEWKHPPVGAVPRGQ